MSGTIHSDPRTWEAALSSVNARSAAGAWSATAQSVADLRAFLAACVVAAAQVAGLPAERDSAGTLVVHGDVLGHVDSAFPPFDAPARKRVAAALLRTVPLLNGGGALERNSTTLRTVGGGAPVPASDAAGINWKNLAAGQVALALLGPWAFPLQFASAIANAQAISLEIMGDPADDVAELQHASLLLIEALRLHQQAEEAAGHALPLSPALLALLARVEAAQQAVAERKRLGHFAPNAEDPFSWLRKIAEKTTDAAAGALSTFAIVAGLALAAYLVIQAKR